MNANLNSRMQRVVFLMQHPEEVDARWTDGQYFFLHAIPNIGRNTIAALLAHNLIEAGTGHNRYRHRLLSPDDLGDLWVE
jgi:hypothetical protein